MGGDSQLENKVTDYIEAAKENKNVDVAALMLNALQMEDENKLSSKAKHWGYLISVGAPPLGLLFAAWFYFSDKNDGKHAAWICLILTAVALALFALSAKLLFVGSGASVSQIQQIKPSDIMQLSQ